MANIGSSVGVKDGIPCYNNPDDQKIVMDLLEKISSADGGVGGDPRWKRPADGALRWNACPDLLRAAILNFQTKNQAKLPFRPDGHVDPGGATIELMNSMAAGGAVTTIGAVTLEGGLDEVELEIHDLRIQGGGRFGPKRHARYVNSKTPISAVLGLIDIEIRHGREVRRLDILAHGFHVDGEGDTAPLFGVMVGREGIHPGFRAVKDLKDPEDGSVVFTMGSHAENLSMWRRFRGRIDEIRFYSCGAANRIRASTASSPTIFMEMSGYQMCQRLALESGAYVMAAEQNQGFHYTWDGGDWPFRRANPANTRVAPTDFGAWEGPVHVFSPINGSVIATSSNGADPAYTTGS